MTPLPPYIIAQSFTQADDWGVLLFIVAVLLAGVVGWRWVEERER